MGVSRTRVGATGPLHGPWRSVRPRPWVRTLKRPPLLSANPSRGRNIAASLHAERPTILRVADGRVAQIASRLTRPDDGAATSGRPSRRGQPWAPLGSPPVPRHPDQATQCRNSGSRRLANTSDTDHRPSRDRRPSYCPSSTKPCWLASARCTSSWHAPVNRRAHPRSLHRSASSDLSK
jgi:hypothetical protein